MALEKLNLALTLRTAAIKYAIRLIMTTLADTWTSTWISAHYLDSCLFYLSVVSRHLAAHALTETHIVHRVIWCLTTNNRLTRPYLAGRWF
jgi:hypothetical protein